MALLKGKESSADYTYKCSGAARKKLGWIEIRGGVEDTRLEAKDTKNPRPRSITALPRTDPLEAKDRNVQGLRLRTQAQVFSKKKCHQKFVLGDLKKKVFKIFFQTKKLFKKIFLGDLQLRKTKKGLRIFSAKFQAFSNKISTVQKIVLSSSRGQGNF